MSTLTIDTLRDLARSFKQPPPRLRRVQIIVVPAHQQRRTPIIDRVAIRPRVPSKAKGRRGTRRNWRRAHPPRLILVYEEPTDLLLFGDNVIATERQRLEIERSYTP